MEVIYSVGSKIPGGGIGNVAYYAIDALKKRKILKKSISTGGQIVDIKFPFLNLVPSWVVKDNLFDFFSSFFVEKCSIFHGWNNMCYFAAKRAKKFGAKIVVERASSHIKTQEDLLKEEYKIWGVEGSAVNPFTLKKSLLEYEIADYILVPSEFARKSFLDWGLDPRKVKLLPFGVDLNKFKKKQKLPEKFTCLFIGQVGIRKGVQYLLKAWRNLSLKNSELVIVGPIFPDFKKFLKDFVLPESVKFLDYSYDLPSLYKSASVFVFPSIEEGSALVTYEAMASGLPIITTKNSGSPIEEGKTGFIVPIRDFNSLAEKIEYFQDNPSKILEFGNNARNEIENYSWNAYQKKLVNFYSRIKYD